MIGVLFDTLAIATATTVAVAIVFALVARARRRRAERRQRPSSRQVSVRVTADTSEVSRVLAAAAISSSEIPEAARRLVRVMACQTIGHDFVTTTFQRLCEPETNAHRYTACRRCGERPPALVWEGDYA